MSARTLRLTPLDAWFFRDGRPYNQGESGQTDIRSLFPPFAPTVVGTVRAALALGQGWSGAGAWNEDLHPILGNGFDHLGQLKFHGPFLTRQEHWLFPVPFHIFGVVTQGDPDAESRWIPSAFLAPTLDRPIFESDLGQVRLPAPIRTNGQRGQLKEPTGLWTTKEGYKEILLGRMPDASTLFYSDWLWKIEPRIGLARDHDRRAAEEGKLYSPAYVRLEGDVQMAIVVDGVPDNWAIPDLIAFGGESRMAYCESSEEGLPLPQCPAETIRKSKRFTVSLLSPLCLLPDSSGRLVPPLPGGTLPALRGSTIVSGCVGKPIHIGGWNSLRREPLPLRPYLPIGSTWFCESTADALDSILTAHGQHIGERIEYGFGQIALGAWPQQTGDTK